MTRLSNVVFASLLLIPSLAVAQDAPETTEDASAESPVPPADSTAPVEPVVVEDFYTKATWPLAYIQRDLNIYKGGLELSPNLNIGIIKDVDTTVGLSLGARYGVTEKLEVLLSYDQIYFSPEFEAKGGLLVGAGFQAIRGAAGGKLDVEPKAAFGYDLLSETAVIIAGADVRYKITPELWIGTPMNTPGLLITVKGVEIANTTIAPINLTLPFAVGYQATPVLHAQLSTQLTTIAINEDAGDSTFLFADYIPVTLSGIYALSNALDVTAGIDLGDLKSAGDFFGFRIGVNARI